MHIIDTHCHATPYWYEPVELLIYQMDQNEVDQAVLVQINGQFDNSYQFECEQRYPGRFASVVIVDVDQPDAPQQLEKLVEQGAKGLRLFPDMRSPGDDPLAIWRKANELGLPVTCGGGSKNLYASNAFSEVVEAFPTLPIIIEHYGSTNSHDGEAPPYPLRQKVFSLARYANTYMKIHGLGEICQRNMPVTQPFPLNRNDVTILEMAYQNFGPERLMWGSDYPPVSQREGYANSLHFPMAELESKPEAEREMIFGGTAAKLFKFE